MVSTLSALSSLSSSSSNHFNSFEESTNGCARAARGQLSQFDLLTFTAQKDRAEALEKRVKNVRKKVEVLEGRMNSVCGTVEDHERRERERGRKRRWRWRCMVVLLAALLGILVPGGIARSRDSGAEGLKDSTIGEKGVLRNAKEENMTMLDNNGIRSDHRRALITKTAQARAVADWEPRLRMLDEL